MRRKHEFSFKIYSFSNPNNMNPEEMKAAAEQINKIICLADSIFASITADYDGSGYSITAINDDVITPSKVGVIVDSEDFYGKVQQSFDENGYLLYVDEKDQPHRSFRIKFDVERKK